MTSREPDGPRHASLIDQMAVWLQERLATHDPPETGRLHIPAPLAPPTRTPE